jgi:Family of unknown function (DUF6519)
MDGDFKGDFTRDSFAFDPLRPHQFSRVLMQQGRVQLDADWNEQADLLLYAQRRLIKDLVGRHWGAFDFVMKSDGSGIDHIDPNSFKINNTSKGRDFSIGKGYYYVDGILAENREDTTYQKQEPKQPIPGDVQYLVYLDVWERQITFLEDGDIREVALGENGPDTATRAEVVWQVKILKPDALIPPVPTDTINSTGQNAFARIRFVEDATQTLVENLQPESHRGQLKARGKAPSDGDVDPCITPPDAQFRGDENQLYRVEIHTGGTQKTATFKWSRENGSVVFPIVQRDGYTVVLENLGRDSHLSLEEGDWVEIVDDDYLLQVATLQGPDPTTPLYGSVNPLLLVDKIEIDNTNPTNVLVTLKNTAGGQLSPVGQDPQKHPLLRRWDQRAGTGKKGGEPKLQKDGTIQIIEGITEDSWLTLEDGVQIQFQPEGGTIATHSGGGLTEHVYRTGDYWLIPARTITGDVLWPQENDPSTGMPFQSGYPESLPPHGVKHHYALLAVISFDGNTVTEPVDLRYMVPPLGKLAVILDIGNTTGLSISAFSSAGL